MKNVYFQINETQIKDYLVNISCKYAGIDISGVLVEDTISIMTSSNFSESIASAGIENLGKGVIQGVGNWLGLGNVANTLNNSFKTAYSTIKTYESSSGLSISFSINIFRGQLGMPSDYKDIEEMLSKLTQPKITNTGSVMTSELYSVTKIKDIANPFSKNPNYKIFDGDLICISIGNWFRGCGFFCESATRNYSSIIDSEGKPLYLTSNITLTFYRTPTAIDIKDMFNV